MAQSHYAAAMTSDSRPSGQPGDKYIIRFPEGMRDRIAEAAKANRRSMNAEIIARLQATFDETVVTTVQARAVPGPGEVGFEFNADEIAEKVVEKLQGRKSRQDRESVDATPSKVILVGNLGGGASSSVYGPSSYLINAMRILAGGADVKPRGNAPHGPKGSPNAKKRPPTKP